LKDSLLGTCLSWGNQEFLDADNPDRTAFLNAKALGAAEVMKELITNLRPDSEGEPDEE
jgi:hypothetical protein